MEPSVPVLYQQYRRVEVQSFKNTLALSSLNLVNKGLHVKHCACLDFCPRRVLAQRPKPEEALIGPPAYKECEILV